MPIDELRVLRLYRELVPRPSARDLELLRQDIKANGLDPSRPVVVNEDLVVLDGHSRLEIAADLGLEWVYVTVKDLADNLAEREYVIKANLARRQLNTAQRAELGLKLLEIEKEKAKKRQQLAGKLYGRGQESPSQEEFLTKWVQSLQEQAMRDRIQIEDKKLDPNSEQPITCKQSQDGRALEIAAQQVGVGKDTLYRAEVIQQAAQEDPQIAAEWEDALAGKTTVNRVYRQARKVRIKDLPKHYGAGIGPGPFSLKLEEPEPQPEPRIYSDEEKWQLLWMVADHQGVQRETLRHIMTTDKTAWFYWHQIVHGGMIESIGWSFIMDRVERYEKAQIAKLVSERPLPEGAAALGPWALDHVHVAGLPGLVAEFPAEAAHMVFTDARQSGPEEWEELAAFGRRALVPGK
ncbi:MAG: ParB N-terminal domain-containing protein, partial [Halothiobacillaceae bacterium]